MIVVLFLFLFDLRTAAISCTAIPLSLLAATLALERMGASLNTMTLGGLAIAIGVVVDDAVIDVENIVRRLRENRRSSEPRPFARVVLDATLEVRSAVVYATFAVILVVLPVMTLSGTVGRLFAPLRLAYTMAVLASLVVALTVTPALSMALLPGRVPARDPPVIRWMRAGYQALLRRLADRPRTLSPESFDNHNKLHVAGELDYRSLRAIQRTLGPRVSQGDRARDLADTALISPTFRYE